MKTLPIVLGVIIVGLLAALIFIPGRNADKNGTSNPTSTPSGNETPSGTVGENPAPVSTSTLYRYTSTKGKTVNAYIAPNQKISTGFRLTGNVPAGWAFEASFPWQVTDSAGKVLGQGPASVPNWMTAGQNWFSANLSFTQPSTASGFIVLKNDNPSGMPENEDLVRIPVKF